MSNKPTSLDIQNAIRNLANSMFSGSQLVINGGSDLHHFVDKASGGSITVRSQELPELIIREVEQKKVELQKIVFEVERVLQKHHLSYSKARVLFVDSINFLQNFCVETVNANNVEDSERRRKIFADLDKVIG